MSRRGPVGYTCPDIDRFIKEIDNAKDYLQDALNIISDFEGQLEDLRSDNDALRNWGHEQEDRADSLELELEELKSKL